MGSAAVVAWLVVTAACTVAVCGAEARSGYLAVSGARLFYRFYAAQQPDGDNGTIILFLQGGPGCASTFGDLFEVGPFRLDAASMTPLPNPYAWNRRHAMLFIDFPLGTGFSFAENATLIPSTGKAATLQLYDAIQVFFRQHASMQQRPLVIVGESYGAKFAARLAALAIQYKNEHSTGSDVPLFKVQGVGLGDGLVVPKAQLQAQTETAMAFGLLSPKEQEELSAMQKTIVEAIDREEYLAASIKRQELLAKIRDYGGLATLLDVRRDARYDPTYSVQRYLNLPSVRLQLGVTADGPAFLECNPLVDTALAIDRMQSAHADVERLLSWRVPILTFQGQFDGQDGVMGSTKWLDKLSWKFAKQFSSQNKVSIDIDGRKSLLWRSFDLLTHVVIRGAGHMAPHDQPQATQQMMETWIASIPPHPTMIGNAFTVIEIVSNWLRVAARAIRL